MWENRVVRYVVYGTGFAILSEVAYQAFRTVYAWWGRRPTEVVQREVAEVIWTNELTQSCAGCHNLGSSAAAAAKAGDAGLSPRMEPNGRITRLPKPTAEPVCQNPFCAANNVGRLIAFIDQVKYTIDLAMYTFTSYDLSQAFNRALRRGVLVRIISDNEMVYSSGSQITNLTKAGVPVRCPHTKMLMHHKFLILDGPMRLNMVRAQNNKVVDEKEAKGILMSGSLNWTMQGFGGNWENILITSNKTLVNKFEEEFQRMWMAFDV